MLSHVRESISHSQIYEVNKQLSRWLEEHQNIPSRMILWYSVLDGLKTSSDTEITHLNPFSNPEVHEAVALLLGFMFSDQVRERVKGRVAEAIKNKDDSVKFEVYSDPQASTKNSMSPQTSIDIQPLLLAETDRTVEDWTQVEEALVKSLTDSPELVNNVLRYMLQKISGITSASESPQQ